MDRDSVEVFLPELDEHNFEISNSTNHHTADTRYDRPQRRCLKKKLFFVFRGNSTHSVHSLLNRMLFVEFLASQKPI